MMSVANAPGECTELVDAPKATDAPATKPSAFGPAQVAQTRERPNDFSGCGVQYS
jgi:hypothetical protein